MHYVETLPPAPLRPFVRSLWQPHGTVGSARSIHGSPGGRADMVFDLAGGADRAIADGAACALVGTASRPHAATLRGEVDLFRTASAPSPHGRSSGCRSPS